MEEKRMIPFSVYLPREIHAKLKDAAQGRKATGMVRDAIIMFMEGDDMFNAGYNKAMRDAIVSIQENKMINSIAIDGEPIANQIVESLEERIIPQNANKRGKHGNKKEA